VPEGELLFRAIMQPGGDEMRGQVLMLAQPAAVQQALAAAAEVRPCRLESAQSFPQVTYQMCLSE